MGKLNNPQQLDIRQQLSLSAGQFISVNGDQLQVNVGNGLADDGSNNIEIPLNAIQLDELDLSISPTWTGNHTFNSVLTMAANIDMNNSGTIINIPSPSSDGDVAPKSYVDGSIEGLNLKASSRVGTDGTNIDLTSSTDPNPIDGISLNNGDRVLLKDQTNAIENGIYNAVSATDPTTWVRAIDFDDDVEVTSGAFTFVGEGTVNGGSSWIVVTDDPITVGTDAIKWEQFSSAGQFSAGDGLSLSGNEFSVDESFDFTFTSIIDFSSGLDTQGDITDGGQTIWDESTQEIPDSALGSIDNSTLTNNSITLNAGDGLKNGSTAQLGGSFGLDIEPANFAGTFLNDDGSDNLQVNIGNGLENDGFDSIAVQGDSVADEFLSEGLSPHQLSVNIGNGLEGDGSNNIRIRADEIAGNALSEGVNPYELSVNEALIDISNLAGVLADANIKEDGDILAFVTNALDNLVIRNVTDNTDILEIDENTGDILSNNVIPNSALDNDSITVVSGDGLKNGGSATLGSSLTIDIEPADFAGTFLIDDGSDNLTIDIGKGLENNGTGTLQVNEDTDFTFTSNIDFASGLAVSSDGSKIFYGADLDMSSRYDAGEDELKWRDETNSTDRMSLARTTGDLTISGTLDETSSP